MCNAYRLITPLSQVFDVFSEIRLPVRIADPQRLPNAPYEMVRPTQVVPILRPVDPTGPDQGVELALLRWGLIPGFHRGGVKDWKFLCTNARSETVATTRSYRDAYRARRCLVPADGFFEWTGEKGAKTKWLFTRADAALFCFAGLWERWAGPEGELQSFTLLTTAPGPDALPYHDRQPVLLARDAWRRWLDLAADPSGLLHADGAGSIAVRRAD
jgi:putative SOS response-associated peptidase YedK